LIWHGDGKIKRKQDQNYDGRLSHSLVLLFVTKTAVVPIELMNEFHSLAFKIDHLSSHAKATEIFVVWHGARNESASPYSTETHMDHFQFTEFSGYWLIKSS
jgi:hypothetical protein